MPNHPKPWLITPGVHNIAIGNQAIGHTPNTEPTKYKVGGHSFEMEYGLNNEEISFLSMITILGSDHYDNCLGNGYYIRPEIREKLDPIIKLMKRKETIGKVLKNKEK